MDVTPFQKRGMTWALFWLIEWNVFIFSVNMDDIKWCLMARFVLKSVCLTHFLWIKLKNEHYRIWRTLLFSDERIPKKRVQFQMNLAVQENDSISVNYFNQYDDVYS